jgi:membrane-associated phospholipid phosphatase
MIIDKDRLAKFLSRVFHPFAVCLPSLWTAIYLHTNSLQAAFLWSAVTLVVFLLPLGLFVRVMVTARRYSDHDISVRAQRHSAYLAAGISLLLLIATYALAGAPRIAYACILVILFAALLGAAINRITKVSLHTTVAASCAIALGYLSWPIGVGLGLGVVAVGWARLHLKHHTVGQVLLGLIVAFFSATVVFGLYL